MCYPTHRFTEEAIMMGEETRVRMHVYVKQSDRQELDRICERKGINRSEYIRRAVRSQMQKDKLGAALEQAGVTGKPFNVEETRVVEDDVPAFLSRG